MRFLTLPLLATATIAIAASAAQYETPADARGVILGYYAAIERGDFRSAYAAWSDGGQASGKSFAAFRQGFAATAHSRVVAGTPVNGDAGMSQRWIEVPVDVYATLKNGARQHFRGSYVLHRTVAGVGAPVSDQHWHIQSAKLTPVR